MSFESLLLHKLEVYRRVEGSGGPGTYATDRFGQPLTVNPRQHEAGGETLIATYPCRAWQPSGGLAMNEKMTDTFERLYSVYTLPGLDIREDDALRAIDGHGRQIFGLAKIKSSEVKYNSDEPHHIELTVWEQSGPDGTAE